MPEVSINYVSVIVAALIPMIVGMVWYSGALFGKSWLRLTGKTPEDIKRHGSAKPYFGSLIASLIMAFVLSHLVSFVGATTALGGLHVGFWVWFGFVMTTALPDYLYVGRPMKLYAINVGYHLASLLLMGMVLARWM